MESYTLGKNIERLVSELVDELRNSPEYKAFEGASERMNESPHIRERIDAFRARAYRVNNSPDHTDPFEDMRDLMIERDQLRGDTVIDAYLTAEMRLCRLLQQICSEVLQTADMGIDGFSDQI